MSKKLKTILAVMLAAALSMAIFASCTRNDEGDMSSKPSSEISSDLSSDISSDMSNPSEDGTSTPGTTDAKLSAAHEAAAKALGEEGFIANPMDDTARLTEIYGVDSKLVEASIVEIPMISAHVGTFIGIKAVSGKGEDVEKALVAYKDKIAADEMQYPSNRQKTKAGMVHRDGDYVFYVMLGAVTDEAMDKTEAEQLTYYQAENQKAVDAIKDALSK